MLCRIISDAFTTSFLYENKKTFNVYPTYESNDVFYGASKSPQRFAQCIKSLKNMQPAVTALFSQVYYDKETQDSVRNFTEETIADVINNIENSEIDIDAKESFIARFKAMKFSIMTPGEILDQNKFLEIYQGLDVDGSESLVELHMSFRREKTKLNLEKLYSWKRFLNLKLIPFIQYFPKENELSKTFSTIMD